MSQIYELIPQSLNNMIVPFQSIRPTYFNKLIDEPLQSKV